jgi:hypothetical protein
MFADLLKASLQDSKVMQVLQSHTIDAVSKNMRD